MTNLDLTKAIEAGALASKRNWYPAVTEPCDDHREDARACLEAALPHIRVEIAKQVRAAMPPLSARRSGQTMRACMEHVAQLIEKGTTK